ncbi:piggyBac transposable element-derived protein 3-like [Phymastichus coffea]|uniref:piggyBac transposable element-derived protein 3-like n=1 Tax=Phymastichus coffea TaxID=108790 RepID=UPI00273BDFD3|nr:piggyBac transposable element-derived protein 3-like [Phymastichus coffea]
MGRTEFDEIKSNLKYSNPEEEDKDDRIWRIRKIVDIFNKNIKRFNFFLTTLSIDEMMAKYYDRWVLKQFIKGKPIRFGIKLWALCSYSGFLFHFEIYCGKNAKDNLLPNIALGSRVVLQMLQHLLHHCTSRKLNEYHYYFDNLFCCPDLLLHLKINGLRATGTVRSNRIKATNDIRKQNGAPGVTPMSNVSRYDKESRSKIAIPFPNTFCIYNKFMGGVDLHDQHANQVRPSIHSKKWTWIIMIRLVQAAATNATATMNTTIM